MLALLDEQPASGARDQADAGGLAGARVVMAGTGDDIANIFCAAETRSLTTCSSQPELLANAYTKWDGPRTDVADTTNFYLNRFGAPDTVVNVVAQRTGGWRNATFPLELFDVDADRGRRTHAHARGHIAARQQRYP